MEKKKCFETEGKRNQLKDPSELTPYDLGASITVNVTDPTGGPYELYQVLKAWEEGGASWQGPTNGANWEQAGAQGIADRGATALASVSINAKGRQTFNLNADGVELVQAWVDGRTINNGFILANADTTDSLTFDSREAADSANRPTLNISFIQTGAKPGDFDNDGDLDNDDVNALSTAIINASTDSTFDLDNNGSVENSDMTVWIKELKNTWFGDANLDGEFNSSDLVVVFVAGEYQDATAGNSTWSEGDWNADGDFTSGDLVTAFIDGGFESGPRNAVASFNGLKHFAGFEGGLNAQLAGAIRFAERMDAEIARRTDGADAGEPFESADLFFEDVFKSRREVFQVAVQDLIFARWLDTNRMADQPQDRAEVLDALLDDWFV